MNIHVYRSKKMHLPDMGERGMYERRITLKELRAWLQMTKCLRGKTKMLV